MQMGLHCLDEADIGDIWRVPNTFTWCLGRRSFGSIRRRVDKHEVVVQDANGRLHKLGAILAIELQHPAIFAQLAPIKLGIVAVRGTEQETAKRANQSKMLGGGEVPKGLEMLWS